MHVTCTVVTGHAICKGLLPTFVIPEECRQQVIFSCVKLIKLLFNPLSANPTKRSNTVKQFVGNLPANCLSVFGHFVKLALKGLK